MFFILKTVLLVRLYKSYAYKKCINDWAYIIRPGYNLWIA